MSAKLTLLGLAGWTNAEGKDLFENLSLPDGIDKQTLIDNILLRGGEFEVLYSDPDFISYAIGAWSRKWNRTMTKWVQAVNLDYEPLWNYDRTEEWTTTDDGSTTGNGTSTGTSTGTGTTKEKVSAYNSDDLRDNTEGDSTTTGNQSNTSTSATTAKNTNVRKGRAYGNIGVTTSSALLSEYLSVSEWNLYEHITDLFLAEFVLPIY